MTAIKSQYPKIREGNIHSEEYTGTTMDRPEWNKLVAKLQKGDVVVFEEVSRMARTAEEGYAAYQMLFDKGVDLEFIKQPSLNTAAYREALKGSIKVAANSGDSATDNLITAILDALNEFMMQKVRQDIKRGFEEAEDENRYRNERIKGGIAERQKRNAELMEQYPDTYADHPEYSQIGRAEGDKLHIKKAEPLKKLIKKYSKDFDGNLNDTDLINMLKEKTIKIEIVKRSGKVEKQEVSAKISRNTLKEYKRQMQA